MRKLIAFSIIAAATVAAAPGPATASDQRAQVAQACGWYAIFGCGRTPDAPGPGRVIWTDDYPNFRPGFYCNVIGPSSYDRAVSNANRYGGYAKSGC